MANKRILSLQIVDTDAFLEMPQSSQLLYFHLVMRADDEGFIGNHKKIMRFVGSQDDDLKVLIAKKFILTFDSGIIVIKHWLVHNTIRMDRFNTTAYKEEKKTLTLKENKSYTKNGNQMATNVIPNDNQVVTQVKLSKVKLSKDSITEASSVIGDVKIEPPSKNEHTVEWNSDKYIDELLIDKKKHIIIIGNYFKEKGYTFPDKETAQKELRRWVKDASIVSKYDEKYQTQVFDYVVNKFPDMWNLSTMAKFIGQEVIWN